MRLFSFLALVVMLASALRADQLGVNTPEVTDAALQVIQPDTALIVFCSECDHERIEILRVIDAVPTPFDEDGLLEIRIFAERLFISKEKFNRGAYREPISFEEAVPGPKDTFETDIFHSRAIDLAYVYAPLGGARFGSLCGIAGSECEVSVREITLPLEIVERLEERMVLEHLVWGK